MLQAVSHSLGLGFSTDADSVMNKEHEGFKSRRARTLSRADTRALQV